MDKTYHKGVSYGGVYQRVQHFQHTTSSSLLSSLFSLSPYLVSGILNIIPPLPVLFSPQIPNSAHVCHDQLNTCLSWSAEHVFVMISWTRLWHDHLPTHSWWEIDGLQPSAVEYNNSFGFVVVLHVITEDMLILYTFSRPLTSTWLLCQAGYQWSFLFHIIYIWSQRWRHLYHPKKAVKNSWSRWWTDLDWHPLLLANILPVVRHFSAAVTLQFQVPPDGMCWSYWKIL